MSSSEPLEQTELNRKRVKSKINVRDLPEKKNRKQNASEQKDAYDYYRTLHKIQTP